MNNEGDSLPEFITPGPAERDVKEDIEAPLIRGVWGVIPLLRESESREIEYP